MALEESCCICLRDMRAEHALTQYRCGHRFHEDCERNYAEGVGLSYSTATGGQWLKCPVCMRTAVDCKAEKGEGEKAEREVAKTERLE